MRALGTQERGVEELRARASTLLTASSLIASVMGARALRPGSIDVLSAFALASLGVSIVLCVHVLLPKPGLVFSINARAVFETLDDCGEDEAEAHRRLIYWTERCRLANQRTVDGLSRYFLLAAGALTLQLAFWTCSLAAKLS